MGLITIDVTGDGTGSPVTVGSFTGTGHILSAAASVKDGSTVSGNTLIEVAVGTTENSTDNKTAVLIDDYVYDTHSPAWDGKLPIDEGDFVIVTMRSFDTATIRVVVKKLANDP